MTIKPNSNDRIIGHNSYTITFINLKIKKTFQISLIFFLFDMYKIAFFSFKGKTLKKNESTWIGKLTIK